MSVEFQPVKLGPRRQRGVDPVAIGALIVAIGIVAAVVKPWAGSSDSTVEPPQALVSAAPVSRAPPSPTGLRSTPAPTVSDGSDGAVLDPPSWAVVRPILQKHDQWGIRAIVVNLLGSSSLDATDRIGERWFPLAAPPGTASAIDPGSALVLPVDPPIVALGVTFPADETPLDARIWLIHDHNELEWIDARPIEPSPAGGALIFVRADMTGSAGSAARSWGAGTYRIDLLGGGAVRRIEVAIPGRFGNVPPPRPAPASESGLVPPELVPIADLGIGPFAMVDGIAVSLEADVGPGLTEAGAWLNVDPGTGRAPRSFVASTYLPRATGLGVVLPAGSLIEDATIGRLAPDSVYQARPDVIVSGRTGRKSFAGFLAPGGGAWPTGVYRFSVVWSDATGLHTGYWHLELRPGPLREQPSLLAAARAYARYAGASGVVVHTAEPLEAGPQAVAIRLLRPQPLAGTTGSEARDLVPCEGVRVDGLSGIVGVAHPVDGPPSRVTVTVLFEFSKSGEQPILTAADDVPGLILVAPVGEMAPTSTAYRVRIGDDPNVPGTTVCLGTSPRSS